jgi:hypothetical protein
MSHRDSSTPDDDRLDGGDRMRSDPASPERDYAGAIYGSLLAASVVAGTSPGRVAPSPGQLAVLLLATGLVFWLAHVYASLFGGRQSHRAMEWSFIREVAAREWPIVEAVVPPAAVALVGMVFGMADSTTAWLALGVAVAGQVGWAVVGARSAGASRRVVALSAVVNLTLGLMLVILKAVVAH